MKKNNFYITTTLPYINAPLHVGHATEIIRADAIARYKKLQGYEVFFNTGTDEHGIKIYESAQNAGQSPKDYTDKFAALFKETLQKFGISSDPNFLEAHYIRTTDEHHILGAKEFWKRCFDAGFIYKKNYKTKYCVGCEEGKTDSQLVDGKCPEHTNREIEIIEEENYFFKFSEFGEKLSEYFNQNPNFITPEYRMNEMREFIKNGLQDFSISRLKTKMPWGIAVPGDDEHVMYVWFDALTNYISTLGWPDNVGDFEKFWADGETVQYCGKDNTRFQSVMWQAMLFAAGLPNTGRIIVNGFILGEGGVKMSKTLGNTIDPLEIIEQYGTEALRYFVLREFHPFEDTAVSINSLKDAYNANLANGIGNLVSRVMKMAGDNISPLSENDFDKVLPADFCKAMDSFNIQSACDFIWQNITEADKLIQDEKPFSLVKENPEKAKEILITLVKKVYIIALMLEPILPETAAKIKKAVLANEKPENLFTRKD